MGSVRKYLHSSALPRREKHHSRLFIDLAENIHIHHREYRTVFSLDEYFEYADIVSKSTQDVRNFLIQNSDYKESEYPTTIMIAGGKDRQLKFLGHSPEPNKSEYYDEIFAIELQDEYVTDEIHIHYRDFRIGVDRTRFRKMAEGFVEALSALDLFEKENSVERKSHPDRIIDDFNNNNNNDDEGNTDTKIMGVKDVDVKLICSFWYKDINDWKPNDNAIKCLQQLVREGGNICPILISTEKDGTHFIVDGHHRYYACLKLGLDSVPAVIVDRTFEQTEKLRKAEVLLKEFDQETGGQYGMSNYLRSYLGSSLNSYYRNAFHNKMKGQSFIRKVIRKLLSVTGAREFIFKRFNESHNHHN
jgi:hypothetical protein